MDQNEVTIGEVSARMIGLMLDLGATKEQALSAAAVDDLRRAARLPLPVGFDEMLGTLELLVASVNHDRESQHREFARAVHTRERWEQHSNRLMELYEKRGKMLDDKSDHRDEA